MQTGVTKGRSEVRQTDRTLDNEEDDDHAANFT
jgi:hypothetical protein